MSTWSKTVPHKQSYQKLFALGLISIAALWTGNAAAGGVFYSVRATGDTSDDKFELYQIQLADGPTNTANSTLLSTSTATCGTTCSNLNRINAFSYNPEKNNLFFFNSNTTTPTLFSVDVTNGGIFTNLGTLSGVPNGINLSGAAFFNNNIYAIRNNSDTVYKISVNYTGNTPSLGAVTSFNLGTGSRAFGDLAIDPRTQTLFGYSTESGTNPNIVPPAFFTYDLKNGGSLVSGPTNTSPSGVQISFGGSDNKLYGVNANGQWFVVDKATGVTSPYALSTAGFVTGQFNDLAGGYPVPGPLPILGAAVAFRASRKLRTRVRQSHPMTTQA